MHAALAITLASLGAIFQAFPALCPCEPRPPRGELQTGPCGARSDTRLLGLPLAASQSARICYPEIKTWICLYIEVKAVFVLSDMYSYPAKINTLALPHPDAFAHASSSARPRGGRAPILLVCTHARALTARSGVDGVDFNAKWIRLLKSAWFGASV